MQNKENTTMKDDILSDTDAAVDVDDLFDSLGEVS